MKPALAKFIIEACENADTFFEDEMPTIREGYSGRGMYGKSTTAIVCGDLMAVMATIACEAAELDPDEYDIDLEDIRHLQTDSMGRSSIVLY